MPAPGNTNLEICQPRDCHPDGFKDLGHSIDKRIETTIAGEVNGKSPDALAVKVARLIEREQPSVRYTCGPAMQQLAARAKYWMPALLFERLIANEFKK